MVTIQVDVLPEEWETLQLKLDKKTGLRTKSGMVAFLILAYNRGAIIHLEDAKNGRLTP